MELEGWTFRNEGVVTAWKSIRAAPVNIHVRGPVGRDVVHRAVERLERGMEDVNVPSATRRLGRAADHRTRAQAEYRARAP